MRLSSALRHWFVTLGSCLGLIVGGGSAIAPAATAQDLDYRSSQNAPAAWRDFALHVRARLSDRLSADDELAQNVRRLLTKQAASQTAAFVMIAKVWVTSDGAIARLEFDGLDDDLSVILRGLLASQQIGARPPPDMLQPLHLQLSLAPSE